MYQFYDPTNIFLHSDGSNLNVCVSAVCVMLYHLECEEPVLPVYITADLPDSGIDWGLESIP